MLRRAVSLEVAPRPSLRRWRASRCSKPPRRSPSTWTSTAHFSPRSMDTTPRDGSGPHASPTTSVMVQEVGVLAHQHRSPPATRRSRSISTVRPVGTASAGARQRRSANARAEGSTWSMSTPADGGLRCRCTAAAPPTPAQTSRPREGARSRHVYRVTTARSMARRPPEAPEAIGRRLCA